MPLVEIDDSELNQLRTLAQRYPTAENFQKVFGKILESPDRLEALKLVKKHFPDVALPEIDTAEAASRPLLDKIAALEARYDEDRKREQEEREKEKQEAQERRVKNTITSAHKRLREEGWDEDGIARIEDLMRERGIGDYDVASAYVRSQMPAPSPIAQSYAGKDLNWFNPSEAEVDHSLLMKDPAKYKSQMITKFVADKANGNLREWAA
jgi:hypothetical protein